MGKIIIIFLIILILFTLMIFGMNFLSWRDDYNCDIGKDDVSGDYELNSSIWFNKWFNERSCAIEDCAVYNKIQKELGSELRCVV